jgi:hypothetical protein
MTDETNKVPQSALDQLPAAETVSATPAPVPAPAVDPDLVAAIRQQVMDELKSEQERERLEKLEERAEAKKAHDAYVAKMKESSDPWVDIQGWVETAEGVRVELDWNDAFVIHLKSEGVTGADDDQIVQRWVTLLLRDMTTQLDDESPEQSEYS